MIYFSLNFRKRFVVSANESTIKTFKLSRESMENCIFCKIVKNEIPSYKIYEDDKFLAFLDIKPFSTAHTLVIPKDHHRWVWDIPHSEIGEFYKLCKKIAQHYQKVTRKEEVYSITSGEEVPHAHYHIIPNVDEGYSESLTSKGLLNARKEFPHDKLKEIHAIYTLIR